jgi:hypothetical protein
MCIEHRHLFRKYNPLRPCYLDLQQFLCLELKETSTFCTAPWTSIRINMQSVARRLV